MLISLYLFRSPGKSPRPNSASSSAPVSPTPSSANSPNRSMLEGDMRDTSFGSTSVNGSGKSSTETTTGMKQEIDMSQYVRREQYEHLQLELKLRLADNVFLQEELDTKSKVLEMLTDGLKEVEIAQKQWVMANQDLNFELEKALYANSLLRNEVYNLNQKLEAATTGNMNTNVNTSDGESPISFPPAPFIGLTINTVSGTVGEGTTSLGYGGSSRAVTPRSSVGIVSSTVKASISESSRSNDVVNTPMESTEKAFPHTLSLSSSHSSKSPTIFQLQPVLIPTISQSVNEEDDMFIQNIRSPINGERHERNVREDDMQGEDDGNSLSEDLSEYDFPPQNEVDVDDESSDFHSDSGLFRTVITPTTLASENDGDSLMSGATGRSGRSARSGRSVRNSHDMSTSIKGALKSKKDRFNVSGNIKVKKLRTASKEMDGDSDTDSHYGDVVQDGVDCLDCDDPTAEGRRMSHGRHSIGAGNSSEAVQALLQEEEDNDTQKKQKSDEDHISAW